MEEGRLGQVLHFPLISKAAPNLFEEKPVFTHQIGDKFFLNLDSGHEKGRGGAEARLQKGK
jgi:hypothetical protein